jgi:hypothetical protein
MDRLCDAVRARESFRAVSPGEESEDALGSEADVLPLLSETIR